MQPNMGLRAVNARHEAGRVGRSNQSAPIYVLVSVENGNISATCVHATFAMFKSVRQGAKLHSVFKFQYVQ